MSIKNARILGIRLDETDASRVAKFENETSIEGVSLARAALKAALAYYEEVGSINVPIKLVIASTKPQDRGAGSDVVSKPIQKFKPAAREPFVLSGSRQSGTETAAQKGGGAISKARRLAAEILAGDKK
jgi:hypothetical protein